MSLNVLLYAAWCIGLNIDRFQKHISKTFSIKSVFTGSPILSNMHIQNAQSRLKDFIERPLAAEISDEQLLVDRLSVV